MLSYKSYQASRNPQSLQKLAIDAIISEIGQVAEGINSRFTCGGKYEVPLSKTIEFAYHPIGVTSSKEWSTIQCPGLTT